jgi:hypothetical protein
MLDYDILFRTGWTFSSNHAGLIYFFRSWRTMTFSSDHAWLWYSLQIMLDMIWREYHSPVWSEENGIVQHDLKRYNSPAWSEENIIVDYDILFRSCWTMIFSSDHAGLLYVQHNLKRISYSSMIWREYHSPVWSEENGMVQHDLKRYNSPAWSEENIIVQHDLLFRLCWTIIFSSDHAGLVYLFRSCWTMIFSSDHAGLWYSLQIMLDYYISSDHADDLKRMSLSCMIWRNKLVQHDLKRKSSLFWREYHSPAWSEEIS